MIRLNNIQIGLALGLIAFLNPTCRADFIVTNLTGVFADPVGGQNQGVGTSFFSTGTPFSAIDRPNRIEFTPLPEIVFPSASFTLPSEPVDVGRFSFFNGVTATGTTATSVGFFVSGTATIRSIDPPLDRPVGAIERIGFQVTPNLTGDPFLDADFWIFPGLARIKIPEGASGDVLARGRLVPQNFASPPQNFLFEFTEFIPLSGGITVTPIPEPSSLVLVGIGTLAVCCYGGWRGKRLPRSNNSA